MHGKRVMDEVIQKMIFLRSQGFSIPEISKEVVIPKTTVLRYIKHVEILPEFLTQWAGKRGGSKKKKLLEQQKALDEGEKIVGSLSSKEKMLFLSALYWAEGSKGDFGLSNTDPDLIKIFVTGLRDVFQVSDDRLRVSVRIYEDLDREKCLSFWSQIVGIPKEHFVNVNVLVGKKKGKLPYGMCRVRVTKGASLLKQIMGINKAMIINLSP